MQTFTKLNTGICRTSAGTLVKFGNVGVIGARNHKKSFLSFRAGDDRNRSTALPYKLINLGLTFLGQASQFFRDLPPKRRSFQSKWFDCMVERRDIMKPNLNGFGRRLKTVNILLQASRVVHLHAVREPPAPRPQLRDELRRLLLLQQRVQEGCLRQVRREMLSEGRERKD